MLSVEETRRVLVAVRTPHNRAYLWTVYSCGLRLNITFTLPDELRATARSHPRTVYEAMFRAS